MSGFDPRMGQTLESGLRDKDALRAALARLSNAELGNVLGMALSRLDEMGETPLPDLLRYLADQLELPDDQRTLHWLPTNGDRGQ